MFKKSSLGLGTKIGAAANKPDLNVGCYSYTMYMKKNMSYIFHKNKIMVRFIYFQSYLKNLKKKQKELSRKHSGGSTDRDQAAEQIKDETEEEEEEEDSDLASIGKIVCLKNI